MPSATYEGTLAKAAEATTRLQEEIDQLWSDSVSGEDQLAAERLVAVSHAIHRVSNLFDQHRVIG